MGHINHRGHYPSENLVPWHIVGNAAYAQLRMNQFPDNHPEYKKYRDYFEALALLAKQLFPWEGHHGSDNDRQ